MAYDCFLSYASDDVVIAEALCRSLTAAGFSVWFDRVRLRPGFDWHREIETAFEASRIVLPLLTPRWKQSEWTRYETYGAEAIIPLVAEGRFEDVATPPLRRLQAAALTVTDGDTEAAGLADAIRVRLAEPPLDATARQRRLTYVRYRPTENFVGRERDLDHLHEQLHVSPSAALTQGRVQAITALGGVGKTTLARMYAEKYWRAYQWICWVDARRGYESEFSRLLDVLLPDLAVTLRDVPDAQRAARALQELERLASSRPLMTAGLLIIDNAEDEQTAAAWIPRTGDFHTIITSRYAHWEAIAVYQIDVLQPEPARELLLQRSANDNPAALPAEERTACDVLAARLGYLPLALEQAAAYIRVQGSGFGFTNYLRLYADNERLLLSLGVRGTTEYPEPLFLTWQTTVAKLPKGARAMLRLAAFLAPTEIPLGLFQGSAEKVGTLARDFAEAPSDAMSDDAPAELRVRAWREALIDYSMAQPSSADTLILHVLVQAVERDQLERKEQQRWMWSVLDLFASYAPPKAAVVEHWPTWRLLLPHAKTLIAGATASGVEPVPPVLLTGTSTFLEAQGRFAEALPFAQLALKQDEQILGPEHPNTLVSVINLANVLQDRGTSAEAEPLLRRALASCERVLGAQHPTTLASVINLAEVLRSRDDFAEAEPLLRRALQTAERVLGPEDPTTLTSMNNLAGVLQDQGAFGEAASLFRRALESREGVLGREHPNTLQTVDNLAGVLLDLGARDEAESLLRRAVEARERVLGRDHPDTLLSVNNLADLLRSQRAFAEAEPLLRRALEGTERSLGPEHPTTLIILNNLAAVLQSQGALPEAETLLRRSLEASERVLGLEHQDTLVSVNNLAGLLQQEGALTDAEPLFRRAAVSLERILGPDHPIARTARANWQRCQDLMKPPR